jgi:hypothetical protein
MGISITTAAMRVTGCKMVLATRALSEFGRLGDALKSVYILPWPYFGP